MGLYQLKKESSSLLHKLVRGCGGLTGSRHTAVATPYLRVQALDLVLGLVPACLLCASSSRCDTICQGYRQDLLEAGKLAYHRFGEKF